MAYISARCHRQRQKPIQIMFANNLVESVSNLIVRWLFYSCILSLLLNTNCDLTVVQASYSEADDLLNELDRPSKYNNISLFFSTFKSIRWNSSCIFFADGLHLATEVLDFFFTKTIVKIVLEFSLIHEWIFFSVQQSEQQWENKKNRLDRLNWTLANRLIANVFVYHCESNHECRLEKFSLYSLASKNYPLISTAIVNSALLLVYYE